MGFIESMFGGSESDSPMTATSMMGIKKRRAIKAATKEIRELKGKQGFSSTLFAGSYKPRKELKTLFADDANKTKTILGG